MMRSIVFRHWRCGGCQTPGARFRLRLRPTESYPDPAFLDENDIGVFRSAAEAHWERQGVRLIPAD